MDLTKILSEMREEHNRLSEAILAFERLRQAHSKRSISLPLSGQTEASAPRKRGRPKGSKNKVAPSE
jgi:hypothetical protein